MEDVCGDDKIIKLKKWDTSKNYEEKLYTEEEIRDKLKGFKPVKDILLLPINTFVRYWMRKNSYEDFKFRNGGILTSKDKNCKYITLRSPFGAVWHVSTNPTKAVFWYKPEEQKQIYVPKDIILEKISTAAHSQKFQIEGGGSIKIELEGPKKKEILPETRIPKNDRLERRKSPERIEKNKRYNRRVSYSYDSDYSLPNVQEYKKKYKKITKV